MIFFTSKMAYQTEIIAILSAGVSFKRLMWPYFLSAAAITLLSLGLNLYVIPAANGERLKFEMNYIKRIKGIKYDQHIYRQIEPGTFIYIRSYSDDKQGASYFALESYEDNAMVSSLEAANVKLDPETGRWTAPRSIRRTFEGEKETFDNTQPLDTVVNLSTTELGRVEELVKTMNIHQLGRFIAQPEDQGLGHDLALRGRAAQPFRLSRLDVHFDDHRRVAFVAEGAGRNGAAHRYRHRAGFLVHSVQQVCRGIRQGRSAAPVRFGLDSEFHLRVHRLLSLQESPEVAGSEPRRGANRSVGEVSAVSGRKTTAKSGKSRVEARCGPATAVWPFSVIRSGQVSGLPVVGQVIKILFRHGP